MRTTAELEDRQRDDRRSGGAQRGHAQLPGPQAEQVIQILFGVGQPREDDVGVAHEQLARVGEPDAGGSPFEQRRSRLPLE